MTINEISAATGLSTVAVKRKLVRHVENNPVNYSAQQLYTVRQLLNGDELPEWVADLWCEAYAVPEEDEHAKPQTAPQPKKATPAKQFFGYATERLVEWSRIEYAVPKLLLLLFQSYVFALLSSRVFSFINTAAMARRDIDPSVMDRVLTNPNFYALWVIGFIVDGAGFAIAAKLPAPKMSAYSDPRLTWIGWFFVVQISIDLCYIFGVVYPSLDWFGAVLCVCAPALGLLAFARASFKREAQ